MTDIDNFLRFIFHDNDNPLQDENKCFRGFPFNFATTESFIINDIQYETLSNKNKTQACVASVLCCVARSCPGFTEWLKGLRAKRHHLALFGAPYRGFNLRKRAQVGLSVAGRCRCLTKDSNTSIEKEGYIPYSLQA